MKIKPLLLLINLIVIKSLLLAGATIANAQIKPPAMTLPDINEAANNTQIKKAETVVDTNAVCNYPDQLPKFVGGNSALLLYLNSSLVYPAEARKKNITGKVVARFLINRYGKVQNLKIVQSLSPECDAEVIRVLYNMPAWNPALKDGIPVNVSFSLPVAFN